DDAPSSFQRGPDPPVDGRGVGVEVHAPYLRQEDVEPFMISLPLHAFLRAVAKLGDRHRAHAEVVRRRLLDLTCHPRIPAVQVVDADIGAEEIFHSLMWVLSRRGIYNMWIQHASAPLPCLSRRSQ